MRGRFGGIVLTAVAIAQIAVGCDHPSISSSRKPLAAASPLAEDLPAAHPAPSPSATLAPEDADRRARKVFATYLPWFETAPGWDHWKWAEHDPDRIGTDGRRDIAAVRYPAVGPYDSRDDAVLGYHLLLMRAAGFDGAFVNWYGRGNKLDVATKALFEKVAAWRGAYGLRFSLTAMVDAEPYLRLESSSQVESLGADLRYVLDTFAVRPEYQRLEGKPLLLFFPKPDPGHPGGDAQAVTPDEMRSARDRAGQAFWLGILHPDPAFKAAADLPYGWIAGAADSGEDFGQEYLDWLYPAIGYQRDSEGWALPLGIGIAYPGFDDGGVHAWSDDPARRRWIAREIGGAATLDLTWDRFDRFIARNPGAPVPWMQVATFNDWNEGSEIEPSLQLGTTPMKQAAARIAAFKAGSSSSPPAEAWAFAARYLEKRRSGVSEAAMGTAVRQFMAGSYAAALASLDPP